VRTAHAQRRGIEEDVYWSYWPEGPQAILPLHMNFFTNSQDAQLFIDGAKDKGNLSIDVLASNYAKDKSLNMSPDLDGNVDLDIFGYKPFDIDSDGTIKSTLDIPGTTLIITELNDELSRLTLTGFQIKLKTGQSIEAQGPFEKVTVTGKTAYRYVFPSHP
jgi:hypothetical protein